MVPERREEITTEGGLDLSRPNPRLRESTRRLEEAGIRVSLFIDPDLPTIDAAKDLGVPAIELHTGRYSHSWRQNHSALDELDHLFGDIRREDGVLVEPLACAIHAVERGEIQLGDTVVLAGAGTLGLLMLQIIKLKNPGQIIVTDAKPERLEMARALGADRTINVKETDPVAKVKSLTDGYGTDVFIEATGYASAVVQGIDMLRKLGTFVAFGVFGEKTSADWSIIGDRKELNIHGAHLGPDCYPKAIDYLYRGVVKSELIVTNKLPLGEFLQGIDRVLNGKGVKIMLDPSA